MKQTKPSLPLVIWNILSLNVGWWSSVLGAANGAVWLGPMVVAVLVGIHLALAQATQREVVTLLAAGAFGYFADSLLVLAGAFNFPAPAHIGTPTSIWMVALWINFATAFNVALYWLVKKPRLGAVLGAVGGPIAYLGGWQFGALLAPNGPVVLALGVAVEWAIATPLVLTAAVLIGRWANQPVPLEAQSRGNRAAQGAAA